MVLLIQYINFISQTGERKKHNANIIIMYTGERVKLCRRLVLPHFCAFTPWKPALWQRRSAFTYVTCTAPVRSSLLSFKRSISHQLYKCKKRFFIETVTHDSRRPAVVLYKHLRRRGRPARRAGLGPAYTPVSHPERLAVVTERHCTTPGGGSRYVHDETFIQEVAWDEHDWSLTSS